MHSTQPPKPAAERWPDHPAVDVISLAYKPICVHPYFVRNVNVFIKVSTVNCKNNFLTFATEKRTLLVPDFWPTIHRRVACLLSELCMHHQDAVRDALEPWFHEELQSEKGWRNMQACVLMIGLTVRCFRFQMSQIPRGIAHLMKILNGDEVSTRLLIALI